MRHSDEQTCLFCKFYKQTRVEHGQCRRYPPAGIGEKFVGKWPEIADTSWCGEFIKGQGEPEKLSSMNIVTPRPRPMQQGASELTQ